MSNSGRLTLNVIVDGVSATDLFRELTALAAEDSDTRKLVAH